MSPVTDDHINPEYAWPALAELREVAAYAGVPLEERLPVYERYLPPELRSDAFDGTPAEPPRGGGSWLSDRIVDAIQAEDAAGRRYRSVVEGESGVTAD